MTHLYISASSAGDSMQRLRALLVGFFLGCLLSLTAAWLILPDAEISAAENRKLSTWAELDIDSWGVLTSQFERYVADQFGARDWLVKQHFRWKKRFGQENQENVFAGAGDWLFLAQKGLLAFHRNDQLFPSSHLASWKVFLDERRAQLAAIGSRYYLLVAPDKHSIYPEHLPGWAQPVDELSNTRQLLRYVDENGVFGLDLTAALLASKNSGQLYFYSDTHWNTYGAGVAYRAVLDWIRVFEGWPVIAVTPVKINLSEGFEGDLIRMQGPLSSEFSESYPAPIFDQACEPSELAYEFENTIEMSGVYHCGEGPTVLLVGDSFSEYLIPYLARSFGTFVHVLGVVKDQELVSLARDLQADIVIQEKVERYLRDEPY